jgi:glutathione S-transferase
MSSPQRTLYQFPISHYCEKARWLLEAKGLPYTLKNLMPGAHRGLAKKLAKGKGSVPVLVDGDVAVGDSTEIALHLERSYPTPALLPPPGPERDRVLELEEFFDDVGIHARRWAYGHILDGNANLGQLMFGEYPAPQRWIGKLMVPLVKRVLRRQYRIYPAQVEESRLKLLAGLDRLERETGGDPSRYLVGSSLTIADITAASLLSPIVSAEGSPYASRADLPKPKAIAQMADEVRARPAGQWVLRRYQQDRLKAASQQRAA